MSKIMDLSGKKDLVTGAGGFIGSHLVEEMVRIGANVRCLLKYNSKGGLGNLTKNPKDIFDRLEIMRENIRDIEAVKRAVQNCEYIFHLAALISIPYSYENPRGYIETNTEEFVKLIRPAQYFCKNCGRSAVSENNLCNPEDLS